MKEHTETSTQDGDKTKKINKIFKNKTNPRNLLALSTRKMKTSRTNHYDAQKKMLKNKIPLGKNKSINLSDSKMNAR